jgi:hypothetical protein
VTGDDLWSDMLSTTDGELYLETVANDPTLVFALSNSFILLKMEILIVRIESF